LAGSLSTGGRVWLQNERRVRREELSLVVLTQRLRDLSKDLADHRLCLELEASLHKKLVQLADAICWHLHVLVVPPVTDGLDELDPSGQVPVHEVHDLPADAHVGAVLLPPVLLLQVGLEELTVDDDSSS